MEGLRILFVDDDASLLQDLEDFLEGFPIDFFTDPKVALKALSSTAYNIVVADYKMPGMTGVELLIQAKKHNDSVIGMLFTGFADRGVLEEVLNRNLVSRYLEKSASPQDLQATLEACIAQWREHRQDEQRKQALELENQALREQLAQATDGVVGLNGGLRRVWQEVQAVANTPASVLLTGETGTGKEVMARLIHQLSPRASGLFVKINCAAVPGNLLESELFGHEKGAYTGATQRKPGKIELADGGTLFLDEIGEMRPDLQVKLLAVLQDKEVVRVGGTAVKKIDFRLICATNADLDQAVKEQQFRRDIYYRIATYPIALPPLRERREDIPALAAALAVKASKQLNAPAKRIAPEALECLQAYSWPGNVRELENALMRALIVMGTKGTIEPSAFGFLALNGSARALTYEQLVSGLAQEIISRKLTLSEVEKSIVHSVLDHFDGKILKAIDQTSIPKHRFYKHR